MLNVVIGVLPKRYLPFKNYDYVALVLGCELASFYHFCITVNAYCLCIICFQMGILHSNFDSKMKCTAQDNGCGISWSWKGPPGEHSPYPIEKFAEKGYEVLYCFVDVLVAFKIMSKRLRFQCEHICFPLWLTCGLAVTAAFLQCV